MKHHRAPVILILAAALLSAIPCICVASERFGPWVYYAPYYFPPDMVLFGHRFCPEDFAPRYESPNPPQPSNAVPPGMMAHSSLPAKASGRAIQSAPYQGRRQAVDRSPVSGSYGQPEQSSGRNRPSAINITRPAPPPAAAIRPPVVDKPQAREPSPGTRSVGRSSLAPAPPQQSRQRQPTVQEPPVEYSAPRTVEPRFGQVDKPPVQYEAPEAPVPSTNPVRRHPSTYAAPSEKAATDPANGKDLTVESGPAKKTWTWGRPAQRNFDRQGL